MMSLNGHELSLGLTDVKAPPIPIAAYLFLGVAGAVNLKGFYVKYDAAHNGLTQIGAAFTLVVPIANAGVTDGVGLPAPPATACGAFVTTDGDVYYSAGGFDATTAKPDFKANPTKYPAIPVNAYFTALGRA